MNYDFAWLWDSVNNMWHIYPSLTPQVGDTALDGSHVCSANDTVYCNLDELPPKCSTCVTNARNQGYVV